jgi:flagellar basal-body rod modification protein FlgD
VHTSLMQMLHSATQPASSPAAASSTPTSNPSSSSTDPGLDLTQTFLQLLSVQLENQSPLNPIDPNQFTSQLAQFDSLGALTEIQTLMQTLVNDVGPTSTPAAASASANAGASANSTSNPSPNSHSL